MNVAAVPSGRTTGGARFSSHSGGRRRCALQSSSFRNRHSARAQREREDGSLEGALQRGSGEAARLVPVVDETGLQQRQDSTGDRQLAAAAEAAADAVHRRLLQRQRLADMTAVMSKAQPELVAIALGERQGRGASRWCACSLALPRACPPWVPPPPAAAQPFLPPRAAACRSLPGARPAGPVPPGGVHLPQGRPGAGPRHCRPHHIRRLRALGAPARPAACPLPGLLGAAMGAAVRVVAPGSPRPVRCRCMPQLSHAGGACRGSCPSGAAARAPPNRCPPTAQPPARPTP